MVQINFSYKMKPYNINKIYNVDCILIKRIEGYQVKNCDYDFINEFRILTYECKNEKVQKLINKAKKSNIQTLRWEYHVI